MGSRDPEGNKALWCRGALRGIPGVPDRLGQGARLDLWDQEVLREFAVMLVRKGIKAPLARRVILVQQDLQDRKATVGKGENGDLPGSRDLQAYRVPKGSLAHRASRVIRAVQARRVSKAFQDPKAPLARRVILVRKARKVIREILEKRVKKVT